MKLADILEKVEAKTVYVSDDNVLGKEIKSAFATDLMSDALAMLKDDDDTTLLITGLANVQSLRTVEMLDLDVIIFVRGKHLDEYIIDEAKDMGINVFKTEYTMFEACGKLYEAGLRR